MLDSFNRDKKLKDGYRNTCKDCIRKYERNYYQNYKQKRIEYFRIQSLHVFLYPSFNFLSLLNE